MGLCVLNGYIYIVRCLCIYFRDLGLRRVGWPECVNHIGLEERFAAIL